MENLLLKKKKKKFLKTDIYEILAYFIIYSVLGFFIETVFALVRYGVLESRQSFLYGPFCSIYGVGAVIMIVFLKYFKRNNTTLFIGGFIIGSITEYLISLIGELILHVKWWDYSNMPFNLNGRICFAYSIFWGVLAIFLIKFIHPVVRNLLAYILKKISVKLFKTLILIVSIFIIIDCIISGYAIQLFTIRMISDYNLDVNNKEIIYDMNNSIKNKPIYNFLVNTLFNNTKMIKTYPNLKVKQKDGSIVYFKDLLPNIKPYYFKFSNQDFYK